MKNDIREKREQSLIYLDHAATTPLCQEAHEAMTPYLCEEYANPSGAYRFARQCREAIEDVRGQLAQMIGANPREIYFTSGGTESDNWALQCTMADGGHMITDKIEHHAILHTAQALEKRGVRVSYLPVDYSGIVHVEQVIEALTEETRLVSLMFANNEIGTIQPIQAVARRLAPYPKVIFHTDAVQAVGHVPLSVYKLGVDMLSASAHKFGGPKGVGFLYMSQRCPNKNLLYGGSQEMGRRAGTENVAGIVGMGAAAMASERYMAQRARHVRNLRDYMFQRIFYEIPNVYANGSMAKRMPGNVNISFSGIEGSSLLVLLDAEGICASAGSACTASSPAPSHVLKAIGRSDELARGAVRFTIGEETTREQIDTAIRVLKESVAALRGERSA